MVRMMVGIAWVVACVVGAACDSGETQEPTDRSATLQDPGGGIDQISGALSGAQCSFFAVEDSVTLCHAANLKKGKYVLIRINEAGCVSGHAGHEGDFVSLDGTCDNDVCLPVGAPADDTILCCDNMEVVDGACACAAGYEAVDGALTCTPIDTGDCSGACSALVDRLLEACLQVVPADICVALAPLVQDSCEVAGCSCELGCDDLAQTLVPACQAAGLDPNLCEQAGSLTRDYCRDSFCEPPADPCAEPVCGDGICCPGEDPGACAPDCAPGCEQACFEAFDPQIQACHELPPAEMGPCLDALFQQLDACLQACNPDPCADPVCGDGLCCPGEDIEGCPADCTPSCEDGCHAQLQQALEACEMGPPEDLPACHDAAFQQLDSCFQGCCVQRCLDERAPELEGCTDGSIPPEHCQMISDECHMICEPPPDPCAAPSCGDGVCCPGEDLEGCPGDCTPSCEDGCHAQFQQALEACEMGPPEDFPACHDAAFQQLETCFQGCCVQRCLDERAPELEGCADGSAPPEHCQMISDECHMICEPPPDPCAAPTCGDGVCCPGEDLEGCPGDCTPSCEDGCHAQFQQALEACEMGPPEDFPACHDAAFQQLDTCFQGCCVQHCLDGRAPELEGCADGSLPPEHCEMISDECDLICEPPPDPCAAPSCGDGVCCPGEDLEGCPGDCTPSCEDGCHAQFQQALEACEMGPPEDFPACHDAAFQQLETCLQGCCVQRCLDERAPELEGCADGSAPPEHCEMVSDECNLSCGPPPDPCAAPACGDGMCCPGETCAEDCEPPPDPCAVPACGDGMCCPGETCAEDCEPPPDPCAVPACGDGFCCVVPDDAGCSTDCAAPCQAVCQDCAATGLTPEDCDLARDFCAPFCTP